VQLTPEDIDSDTKRHQLFETLLNESLSLFQLLCLATLLQIWPVLAATELKYVSKSSFCWYKDRGINYLSTFPILFVFNSEEPSTNPWVQLMDKIIRCHGDGEHVVDMLKQLCCTTSLNVEVWVVSEWIRATVIQIPPWPMTVDAFIMPDRLVRDYPGRDYPKKNGTTFSDQTRPTKRNGSYYFLFLSRIPSVSENYWRQVGQRTSLSKWNSIYISTVRTDHLLGVPSIPVGPNLKGPSSWKAPISVLSDARSILGLGLGVANGPSKSVGLAKFSSNFTGLQSLGSF